jgi:hypothetical protein
MALDHPIAGPRLALHLFARPVELPAFHALLGEQQLWTPVA